MGNESTIQALMNLSNRSRHRGRSLLRSRLGSRIKGLLNRSLCRLGIQRCLGQQVQQGVAEHLQGLTEVSVRVFLSLLRHQLRQNLQHRQPLCPGNSFRLHQTLNQRAVQVDVHSTERALVNLLRKHPGQPQDT